MSRRKKSPQKQPIHTPRQEVKKPEQTALLTRRNVLIGLGALGGVALAWRAGLLDVFKDEKMYEDQLQENTPEPVTAGPRLSEYDEWASKIKLPKMTLLDTPGKLPDMKIPAENLEKFGKTYEQLLDKFKQDFDAQDTAEARYRLSIEFIGRLIPAYRLAVSDDETVGHYDIGSKEFNELILRVNELLINKGHYIDVEGHRNEETASSDAVKTRISVFNVESVRSLQIIDGDKTYTVPTVLIGNQKDYYNRPGQQETDRSRLNGQYDQLAKMIIQHQEGAEAQIDNNIRTFEIRCARAGMPYKIENIPQIKKDHQQMTSIHEGMHYTLDKHGFAPGPYKDVKNKGSIDMGSYQVEAERYVGKFNTEIHELAAIGYGLMHAGRATPLFLIGILTGGQGTYKLAVDIMIKEIHENISREDRIKILDIASDGSQSLDINRFASVISRMPLETLHKIGERMAKLGVYLTQK